MKPELKAKILTYNKTAKERKEKAEDMDVILSAIASLPWGQLKKLLTDDVIAIFEKYGITN